MKCVYCGWGGNRLRDVTKTKFDVRLSHLAYCPAVPSGGQGEEKHFSLHSCVIETFHPCTWDENVMCYPNLDSLECKKENYY